MSLDDWPLVVLVLVLAGAAYWRGYKNGMCDQIEAQKDLAELVDSDNQHHRLYPHG